MWLVSSSIGRKVIMSLSGLFLIMFLCVHLTINLFIFGGADAYKAACHFMENPVIVAIVPVLAAGFLIHILYAFLLQYQNLKARGKDAYAVSSKTDVSFAAKNMLVLGIIVLGFLALHLYNFWAKMQLQALIGGPVAEDPYLLAQDLFFNPVYAVLYLVWILALWFHLSHGFWSAFQTIGVNNRNWMPRWDIIGKIFATLIAVGFASIPVYFQLIKIFGCCQ